NLESTLLRYLHLPPHASVALTLAITLSHMYDAVFVLPIIALLSPTKGCGKTSVLLLASPLVPRLLLTSSVTPAAVFRAVEKYRPTLFWDEAEKTFDTSDELRAIFNASHTRATAMVIRTVGDEHEVRTFSTWCPKWLCSLRTLPPTLTDRSIVIPMSRRPKDVKLSRIRQDRLKDHRAQAQTIARW